MILKISHFMKSNMLFFTSLVGATTHNFMPTKKLNQVSEKLNSDSPFNEENKLHISKCLNFDFPFHTSYLLEPFSSRYMCQLCLIIWPYHLNLCAVLQNIYENIPAACVLHFICHQIPFLLQFCLSTSMFYLFHLAFLPP